MMALCVDFFPTIVSPNPSREASKLLDLRNQEQTKGYLTALEPGESVEGLGIKWKCLCRLCGTNTRMVLARDFKSERIKKCERCVNPIFRRQQRRLCESKKLKLRELGPPFYSARFRRTWRAKLARFTPGQVLVFDVIMDGRRTTGELAMQATDIVLRAGARLDLELFTFGEKRINRNAARAIAMNEGAAVLPMKRSSTRRELEEELFAFATTKRAA